MPTGRSPSRHHERRFAPADRIMHRISPWGDDAGKRHSRWALLSRVFTRGGTIGQVAPAKRLIQSRHASPRHRMAPQDRTFRPDSS